MTTPSHSGEALLVAHDLRNLLSTVLGHADLQLRLLDEAAGDPETLRESLSAMRLAARRASAMCDALLADEPEGGPTAPVELGGLVLGASELLMTRAGGGLDVLLVAGPEVSVQGSHDALERALLNLMWNAVDAQGGTPHPQLSLSWGEGGDGAWLEVADRGPGLPEGGLGNLDRAGRSTRGEGRGLGLHAVARTMRRHGGRLRGRDREGGGAVLRLEFGLERELDFDGPSNGS